MADCEQKRVLAQMSESTYHEPILVIVLISPITLFVRVMVAYI